MAESNVFSIFVAKLSINGESYRKKTGDTRT